MNLLNLDVKHKAFGTGTIISVEGKYITVKFDSANKTFVYPDVFEKYLTLADGSVSDEIIQDLAVANNAKQQIRDKKHEENVRAMTKGIVIPGKDIAAIEDAEEDNRQKSESEE